MNIHGWRLNAEKILAESGCPDPAVDTEWILEDQLEKSRAELRFSDFHRAFRPGESFDIIFLDPPYGKQILEDALIFIDEKHLKRENGIIVAETGADIELQMPVNGPEIIKEKRYGKTKILFLK